METAGQSKQTDGYDMTRSKRREGFKPTLKKNRSTRTRNTYPSLIINPMTTLRNGLSVRLHIALHIKYGSYHQFESDKRLGEGDEKKEKPGTGRSGKRGGTGMAGSRDGQKEEVERKGR